QEIVEMSQLHRTCSPIDDIDHSNKEKAFDLWGEHGLWLAHPRTAARGLRSPARARGRYRIGGDMNGRLASLPRSLSAALVLTAAPAFLPAAAHAADFQPS